MLKAWRLLKNVPVADCRVFSVRRETLLSPRTGRPHDFFVLDGSDWVNVVAVTRRKELVLVRQYRAGTRKVTLEIPGGSVDRHDRSPLATAKRELREETGYVARRWSRIGLVHPNPAIQSNACTTFLAEDIRRVGDPEPEGSEDLRVEIVPLREMDGLLRRGLIRHALVVAAFHWFTLRRARSGRHPSGSASRGR